MSLNFIIGCRIQFACYSRLFWFSMIELVEMKDKAGNEYQTITNFQNVLKKDKHSIKI